MGKKTKQARSRIAQGGFTIPSPRQIEDAKTPAGAWTAKQLAEWGVKWPPQAGWRQKLKQQWEKMNPPENEPEEVWRFMEVHEGDRLVDLSKDPVFACLAVAVATQCTSAGFGKRLVIDIRQARCQNCEAPGFNTGMGFWLHSCGAEILSSGEVCKPCGIGENQEAQAP